MHLRQDSYSPSKYSGIDLIDPTSRFRSKPIPYVPLSYNHPSQQTFAERDFVGKIGWAMQNKQIA